MQKFGNSFGLGIIQFITVSESAATQQVQSLINQAQQEIYEPIFQQKVIELLEKIIVYKFPKKTRAELEVIFDLTAGQQPTFYQQAKEEGKIEAKLEMISILVRFGFTPEQIAQELGLEINLVSKFLGHQNN